MAEPDDIQAWEDGVVFGRRFAKVALTIADATPKSLREHLAGLKALRSGYSDAEWKVWSGHHFEFGTSGFGHALSVVWRIRAGPKSHLAFGDLESAKEVCFPIWSVWLAPDRAPRVLDVDELSRLKRPDFVRGFVDAAARATMAEKE
jgi:hypothetical protein